LYVSELFISTTLWLPHNSNVRNCLTVDRCSEYVIVYFSYNAFSALQNLQCRFYVITIGLCSDPGPGTFWETGKLIVL